MMSSVHQLQRKVVGQEALIENQGDSAGAFTNVMFRGWLGDSYRGEWVSGRGVN